MREVKESAELVAFCGLYCGACKAYLKERCEGCRKNNKAAWCKVRSCCMDSGNVTCADCKVYPNPADCRKFNNIISKLFSVVFRSDRAACISRIKDAGIEGHAKKMAQMKLHTIKRA